MNQMKKHFPDKEKNFLSNLLDFLMAKVLFICALVSVLSLLLITVYIFVNGLRLFKFISPQSFLFGFDWDPVAQKLFGILPMIITSFYVTLGALMISVPLGIACAVFLAEIASKKTQKIVRPAVQLLAGIPSVVFGLLGIALVVPVIQFLTDTPGLSILAAIIILSIMILPTIISISEDSIRAVPRELRESSYALGTTKWQTIYGTVLPASSSGLITAIVLGLGRAFGEAMAVKMVIGNSQTMPDFSPQSLFGLLSLARTLTTNIIGDIEYAEAGAHLDALFATGSILFIFIVLVNSISYIFRTRAYGGSK